MEEVIVVFPVLSKLYHTISSPNAVKFNNNDSFFRYVLFSGLNIVNDGPPIMPIVMAKLEVVASPVTASPVKLLEFVFDMEIRLKINKRTKPTTNKKTNNPLFIN